MIFQDFQKQSAINRLENQYHYPTFVGEEEAELGEDLNMASA